MSSGEQPPTPSRRKAFIEGAKFVGEVMGAVARKVGGDVLRLVGLRPRYNYRGTNEPRQMSDDEVRRWNVEHGFPEDWRM